MKKTFLFTLLLAIFVSLQAQTEKEITSTIKKVTLYTQGAQIESSASLSLQQGASTIKVTKLSPYIRPESIRIEGDGTYTILSVQHQNDYLNQLARSQEIDSLKQKIERIQEKIEDEELAVKITKDKLDFLTSNKSIGGKEQSINADALKSINEYYGSNVEALNLELLKRNRAITKYHKETEKLNQQLNTLTYSSDLPSGTIIIAVDAKNSISKAKMKCTYLVDNASWYPSYDIKFQGFDKKLAITHKANITQNTGVEWKDVTLVLSTAKTDISAQIPELYPFYLQFFLPAPPSYSAYEALQGKASGIQIQDADEEEVVIGYGTEKKKSDMSKSLAVRGVSSSNGGKPLYVVDGIVVDNADYLSPDQIAKMDVLRDASATSLYGSRGANGVILITTKNGGESSSTPAVISQQRETSSEFIVDADQTIASSTKQSTVKFREIEVDSKFEYQTIPKLSENIYLIGRLSEWHKADLMSGEANLYLENAYIGKSYLNIEQFKDTLELSFGVDNNLTIKRERLAEFSENQYIGSNRKETLAYKIVVRNNKSYPVKIKVLDQVPVTTNKDISVDVLETSEGKLNKESGLITWELPMNSLETKELLLKYSIKYPKDKSVIVE